MVEVNTEQGSDVGGNAGRSSSDQRRPFIVVAAASSSGKNADPNEAFIPPRINPRRAEKRLLIFCILEIFIPLSFTIS